MLEQIGDVSSESLRILCILILVVVIEELFNFSTVTPRRLHRHDHAYFPPFMYCNMCFYLTYVDSTHSID